MFSFRTGTTYWRVENGGESQHATARTEVVKDWGGSAAMLGNSVEMYFKGVVGLFWTVNKM